MIPGEIRLAKHRLEGSYEALADAQLLLKRGTAAGALAMGLRAARDAAEAALLADGDEAVRTKSLLFLAMKFIRDGRLSAVSFNAFRTIMDLCQCASERDFSAVNRSEAAAAVENVKYFIREMSEIVKG